MSQLDVKIIRDGQKWNQWKVESKKTSNAVTYSSSRLRRLPILSGTGPVNFVEERSLLRKKWLKKEENIPYICKISLFLFQTNVVSIIQLPETGEIADGLGNSSIHSSLIERALWSELETQVWQLASQHWVITKSNGRKSNGHTALSGISDSQCSQELDQPSLDSTKVAWKNNSEYRNSRKKSSKEILENHTGAGDCWGSQSSSELSLQFRDHLAFYHWLINQ